jgi:hypothetical protein
MLEHLGPSCIDMVTSQIGEMGMGTEFWVLGNTLWMAWGNEIHQVEPFGGKTGRTWILTTAEDGSIDWIVVANGQVWVAGDNGLTRMDIPLNKMTPGPTPATLQCPGAAASPSPTASASATPTASPTPTPTPTPAPTPAPTDTPSPSPAPSDSSAPSDSPAP